MKVQSLFIFIWSFRQNAFIVNNFCIKKYLLRKFFFIYTQALAWCVGSSQTKEATMGNEIGKTVWAEIAHRKILNSLSRIHLNWYNRTDYKLTLLTLFSEGIVKWAEPCKGVILLVSRILWHKRINPSLNKWRFWYLIPTRDFLP